MALGIRDLALGVESRGRAARLFLVLLVSSIAFVLSTVELVRREIVAKDGAGPLARLLGRVERNPALLVPPGQEERDRVLWATLDRIQALERSLEDLERDREAEDRAPDDLVAIENDLMLRLLELRALVERRLAEVRNDLERKHVDQETFRKAMSRLEERLDHLRAAPEESQVVSGPEGKSGSEEADEVEHWLSVLDADEPGLRFSAVVELARVRDPRCLERFSVLLLGDPDQFVRQQVALGMAVFRERTTISVLIKALFDPEPAVGLAAAESLRELTGKTFGFVSKATPSERKAAAQKWEEWWDRENRDR
jgi:HEAT repeat protein